MTGTAATATAVNGLYTIGGTHTYDHPGTYGVTVTTTGPAGPAQTVEVTLHPGK